MVAGHTANGLDGVNKNCLRVELNPHRRAGASIFSQRGMAHNIIDDLVRLVLLFVAYASNAVATTTKSQKHMRGMAESAEDTAISTLFDYRERRPARHASSAPTIKCTGVSREPATSRWLRRMRCAPAADNSENHLPYNSSSATFTLGNVLGSRDLYEFGTPSLAARHFFVGMEQMAVHATADRVEGAADRLASDGVFNILFSNHGSGAGLPKRMRSLTSGLPTVPPRDRYVWTLVIGNFARCDDAVFAFGQSYACAAALLDRNADSTCLARRGWPLRAVLFSSRAHVSYTASISPRRLASVAFSHQPRARSCLVENTKNGRVGSIAPSVSRDDAFLIVYMSEAEGPGGDPGNIHSFCRDCLMLTNYSR